MLDYKIAMTTFTAAQRLGVSEAQIRNLIRQGRLPATKERREYGIKAKDLILVKHRPITGRPKKAEVV